MTSSILSRFVLPLALLVAVPAVPACGGGDGDSGGDGDGDGDLGTGGSGTGGISGDGDGDGDGDDRIEASGTITLNFNGTPVTFDVWQASDGGLGFIASGDSTNSDTVDGIGIYIDPISVGTFNCAEGGGDNAGIDIQAENSEGMTTIFDNLGADDCTITVTEYGSPGEPVRGTFSGVLTASGSMTATITNGTFDLIRSSDR